MLLQQVCNFYQKYENLGLKVTFVLVALQVIHLYWLTTFVIFDAPELTLGIPPILFAIIDYLEIPALVSGLLFYSVTLIMATHKGKSVLYIGLLSVQFLHIFWITDTFVYMAFNFNQYTLLATIAIMIDFLEVVVLYDLYKRIRYNG